MREKEIVLGGGGGEGKKMKLRGRKNT